MRKADWNRYPNTRSTDLINAISEYTGHPAPGIITGNSSGELIQATFISLCEPGDKIVIVSPGFPMYDRLACLMELETAEVPLLEDFSFNKKSIIDHAEGARMVVLASPNNPTGTCISLDDIETILKNIEGILVLDEAYFEFYDITAQNLINKYDNLIIIRTFSKALMLAGLRIGYILARPEMVRQVDKAKLPFSVGTFQQIAGEVMMKNSRIVKEVTGKIIEERGRLFSELVDIPSIEPVLSSTNFILFRVNGKPVREIFDSMKEKGLLIRYFDTGRLENMLRVSVGTPEENQAFLKTLKETIGEQLL